MQGRDEANQKQSFGASAGTDIMMRTLSRRQDDII
jgi:hypothetical protein